MFAIELSREVKSDMILGGNSAFVPVGSKGSDLSCLTKMVEGNMFGRSTPR